MRKDFKIKKKKGSFNQPNRFQNQEKKKGFQNQPNRFQNQEKKKIT